VTLWAVGKTAAPALMVLALIYAISDVSGAHINPAVALFSQHPAVCWIYVVGHAGPQ